MYNWFDIDKNDGTSVHKDVARIRRADVNVNEAGKRVL